MKKTWTYTTAIIVSISLFSFLFKQQAQAHGAFQHVKNYSLYYGSPTAQAITKLKTKDLIIIEPQLYTKEQIKDIQSKGTLVIGYLSLMETPAWNMLRSKDLVPQDYLWQKGERIHFPQWNSYLMDIRQTHYRKLLVAEMQTSIADKGMNGVFLDTVGDIDDYIKDKATQTQTREAYVAFLQDVSKQFPELSIIQNRGFETLDYSASYIDAFLWEDWRANWKKDAWMKANVEKLQKEQKKGLTIFTISLHKESSPGKEARKLKFIHMNAPDGYTKKVY
jgi:uncharacterized protein (TIGR01370 family)